MVDQRDVRRIALSLPETSESPDRFAFSVGSSGKPKAFAWVWLERIHPKSARVPNPEVLALRVNSVHEKNLLIEMDPDTFFTEPHYDGFPAVLVRLASIDEQRLRSLLTEAWKCQAPKSLVRRFEETVSQSR